MSAKIRNPYTGILKKRVAAKREAAAFTKKEPITPAEQEVSFLVDETRTMERRRRLAEQDGERRRARVHAREHSEKEPSAGPEDAPENGMRQHPYLDSQRFDGIDPNLNPEPPLNSEARREYDNAQRDQQNEKQLRLGMVNAPKFNPSPQGPQ